MRYNQHIEERESSSLLKEEMYNCPDVFERLK